MDFYNYRCRYRSGGVNNPTQNFQKWRMCRFLCIRYFLCAPSHVFTKVKNIIEKREHRIYKMCIFARIYAFGNKTTTIN